MKMFKNQHSDLIDCEPSIKFSRTIKALITAMNCRTPIHNLKPQNEQWNVRYLLLIIANMILYNYYLFLKIPYMFIEVIENFLKYLKEWEVGAKKRKYEFYIGTQLLMDSR